MSRLEEQSACSDDGKAKAWDEPPTDGRKGGESSRHSVSGTVSQELCSIGRLIMEEWRA